MKFLKTTLIGLCLLSNIPLQGAVDTNELKDFIHKALSDKSFTEKRCMQTDAEEAKEWTKEDVKAGLLTQDQADLLNKEGMFALFKGGKLRAVCPFGCFVPQTEIMVASGQNSWSEIKAEDIRSEHLAASPVSVSFEELELRTQKIKKAIISPEAGMEHIISFSLENGKHLDVTPGHGMLLADGRMVRASQVKAGEHFIGADGTFVEIKNIENKTLTTKVYNFRLEGNQPHDHLMVASQVLVGDHYWQAEGNEDLGALNIRSAALSK